MPAAQGCSLSAVLKMSLPIISKGNHEAWVTTGLPHMISGTIRGVRLVVVHFALAADGSSLVAESPRWGDVEILDLFADTPGDLVCFGA